MYGFGARLRKARKESRLTLEDVAQKINSTRQTISRYENGIIENVPISTVKALANAVNTTPGYLMGWDDDKREPEILPGTSFRIDYIFVIEDNRYHYFNFNPGEILYFNTDVKLNLFNSFHLVEIRGEVEIVLLIPSNGKYYVITYDGYHIEIERDEIIATCFYKCIPFKERE